ncbi:hypothetical protein [Sorangium sp. So ce388]|uniref:NHL domain-containing protein n=1 Tax=Sorangium sp. So ce388 TaxID=3133309 RepID=UPI003F5C27C9
MHALPSPDFAPRKYEPDGRPLPERAERAIREGRTARRRGAPSTGRGWASALSEPFSCDGGPATLATLTSPFGIAVGLDGSVYIADRGNHSVRRVAPDGIIDTVAGTGA